MKKILFISKAKGNDKIGPIIYNQAISLNDKVLIEHFLVSDKGLKSYINSVRKLKNIIKKREFEIIHAHYGLSGLVALLSLPKVPVVISFMGSDLHGGKVVSLKYLFIYLLNKIISIPVQFFAKHIIVKSDKLLQYIYFKKKAIVIPNGVNIRLFYPIWRMEAKNKIKLDTLAQNILFLGGTSIINKNYELLINTYIKYNLITTAKLIAPYPVAQEQVLYYLNACDVLVLTSFNEGSPNVIKEAMACNCPIVSTDVGDVKEIMGNTEGCYICSYETEDVAKKIKMALEFTRTKGRTNGRQRIIELGLDSENTAKKILEVYNSVLK